MPSGAVDVAVYDGPATRSRWQRHRRQVHPTFRSNPYENPRQVSISFCLGGVLLAISAYSSSSNSENNKDIRAAFLATFLSFLTLSYLQTRDLVLSWPHPGFWRLAFGACAFYALFLVALLQMNKDVARSALAAIFPDIGTQDEFETGLYARIDAVMGTCRLSTTALMRQFFYCPWVLGHAVGWSFKMLIFRDFYMAFFAAAIFELMEVTLMHVVPEFEECWWDSLFLDTLGANLLGMYVGHRMNRWIRTVQAKQREHEHDGTSLSSSRRKNDLGSDLDWIGRDSAASNDNGVSGRLFTVVTSSSPSIHYNWKVFSSLQRLLQVVGAAVFMNFSDLNSFLLINAFGIANNTSWFVLLRLFVVTMIWIPAGAEFYSYINESERGAAVRLGPSIWILCCTTLLELAVAIKFFPSHMSVELEKTGNMIGIPSQVLIPHLISIALTTIWIIKKYNVIGCIGKSVKDNNGRNRMNRGTSISSSKAKIRRKLVLEPVDALLAFAAIPLGYLFIMGWKFD